MYVAYQYYLYYINLICFFNYWVFVVCHKLDQFQIFQFIHVSFRPRPIKIKYVISLELSKICNELDVAISPIS